MVGTNKLYSGGTQYKAEKVITHEKFDGSVNYSIGLIKVQGEIEFNEKVQPIKFSPNQVPDGVSIQVTGWGLTMVSLACFLDLLRFKLKI